MSTCKNSDNLNKGSKNRISAKSSIIRFENCDINGMKTSLSVLSNSRSLKVLKLPKLEGRMSQNSPYFTFNNLNQIYIKESNSSINGKAYFPNCNLEFEKASQIKYEPRFAGSSKKIPNFRYCSKLVKKNNFMITQQKWNWWGRSSNLNSNINLNLNLNLNSNVKPDLEIQGKYIGKERELKTPRIHYNVVEMLLARQKRSKKLLNFHNQPKPTYKHFTQNTISPKKLSLQNYSAHSELITLLKSIPNSSNKIKKSDEND